MMMDRIIKILAGIIFIMVIALIFVLGTNYIKEYENREDIDIVVEEDKWNNGYCVDCDIKLHYDGCGTKYHYSCPSCGKQYIFNSIYKYE